METNAVNIQLTKEESLVLFEFLSRFSESDELIIQHQAEARVLWNVTCLLDKSLVEPFQENYRELLDKAREKLKDEQ